MRKIILALALAFMLFPAEVIAQGGRSNFFRPGARRVTCTSVQQTLDIGSRGQEVVELQTKLVSEGFLTMPRGVEYGYYGRLTYEAVARYQSAHGEISTGKWGYSTRTCSRARRRIGR